MKRCDWADSNEKMQAYHDQVWGVAVYEDQALFRKLMLDINQAGLSWQTILNKMENFDEAYDSFELSKVANYDSAKIEELMANAGVIRNRKKIEAAINNAQRVMEIQAELGSFSDYLWHFTDGKIIKGEFATIEEVPAKTALSDEIAKDLKKRGFKFVGSTTIYAFLQAVGIVNDHLQTCDCYQK
ncbi:DNA-3-methyladenine glycosylase I [Enterococcus sp. PF1-24]|uniref:DNA-3-methyladenine glycosylase I n=1 Tax=unclassified Enterococcus TaxID=2608891 RepID=UPI002472FD18|nr:MULTISPECIES: DNA-3-methyladenine glycosylase I [unclassified Enterococcus]MDH6365751.1 DNA-3-methyladenine glycosylase I [Enterococcus sp. PFB1-1]MDH6402851.1 DNA-3-methyladenine glycosylase I [Enterococcus sp. PF1-24]